MGNLLPIVESIEQYQPACDQLIEAAGHAANQGVLQQGPRWCQKDRVLELLTEARQSQPFLGDVQEINRTVSALLQILRKPPQMRKRKSVRA
jgi:hypothetical protein